jgi:transcriptional regulator with XRE-family HTH domain
MMYSFANSLCGLTRRACADTIQSMAQSLPHEALYRRAGELIREARRSRGITQSDLGNAVGLTRTSIVNIERGRQKILLHSLFEFATALGVEPAALLPRVQDAGPPDIKIPDDLSLETRDFIMNAIITAPSSHN